MKVQIYVETISVHSYEVEAASLVEAAGFDAEALAYTHEGDAALEHSEAKIIGVNSLE